MNTLKTIIKMVSGRRKFGVRVNGEEREKEEGRKRKRERKKGKEERALCRLKKKKEVAVWLEMVT